MAFAGYGQIGDIKCGSTKKGFEDQCEMLWINHQMHQPRAISRSLEGAATTGNVEHGEFKFKKQLDKGSPKIYEALNNAKHIDKVVISLIKPGGSDLVYMKFTLTSVVITSVNMEGNPEGDSIYPIEEIGLSYGGIEWEHDTMDDKGKSKGKMATKYSVLTGKTG